jgi:hypothetical protein
MLLDVRLLWKALRTIQVMRSALNAQRERIIELELGLVAKDSVMGVLNVGIEAKQREILEERRHRLDLLHAWRISIEQPEVDVRDELDAWIAQLRDEVALIEEEVL